MAKWLFWLLVAVFVTVWGYEELSQPPPPNTAIAPTPTATPSSQPLVLGQQVKTTDCQIQDKLPDKNCTPGATISGVTVEQICTPGYSSQVRDVSIQTKNLVYKEYGITAHKTGEYEVDHFISLELGGSNDLANLWPEPADPRPGFHEKDQVENYLHSQVCTGKISLEQAQEAIAQNWLEVYKSISH